MNTPFWTFAALAALSIGALVWGLYGLWRQHLDPRPTALARRLQAASLSSPNDVAEPTLKLRPKRLLSQWAWAERGLQTLPGVNSFDHFLLQTGVAISLAQALSLAAALVLLALAARVASDDVRYFVVAVVIQNETGGNLAEILKNTAHLIRERQKIAGIVRVLSAEGRISAVILSLLPFALAALMALLNPGFISKLWTDPIGLQLVYISLTLMAIGILWMWRLIQIRV